MEAIPWFHTQTIASCVFASLSADVLLPLRTVCTGWQHIADTLHMPIKRVNVRAVVLAGQRFRLMLAITRGKRLDELDLVVLAARTNLLECLLLRVAKDARSDLYIRAHIWRLRGFLSTQPISRLSITTRYTLMRYGFDTPLLHEFARIYVALRSTVGPHPQQMEFLLACICYGIATGDMIERAVKFRTGRVDIMSYVWAMTHNPDVAVALVPSLSDGRVTVLHNMIRGNTPLLLAVGRKARVTLKQLSPTVAAALEARRAEDLEFAATWSAETVATITNQMHHVRHTLMDIMVRKYGKNVAVVLLLDKNDLYHYGEDDKMLLSSHERRVDGEITVFLLSITNADKCRRIVEDEDVDDDLACAQGMM